MRRRAALLAGVALSCLPTASADDNAAWAALQSSDPVVALVRHADAPGAGDPPGWRLDDCATQRNLSDRGRGDARKLGERLREAGVPIAKVLSSPWCRCLDTARLMNVGPVQIEPTFSNAFVLSDRRDALAAGARDVLKAWRGPGTLLVVTHGANIQALTGHNPVAGELVVVRPGKNGALRMAGTLQPQR